MKPKTTVARTLVALVLAAAVVPAAIAQTRSVRDTATAYGARLDSQGQPTNLNQNRLNSRINNRIDNRLSLRIERYRPDATTNPTAAFTAAPNDKSRVSPLVTPPVSDDSPR